MKGFASAEKYVRFLKDVAETSGIDITPKTLRSEAHVEDFASRLVSRYGEKSVNNYRSVMRKYADMVEQNGL